MRCDPHESYNPNFPEEDWKAYQRDQRALGLADKVRSLIDSGRVAVVRSLPLRELSFDIKSRVDYPAPILQSYYSPHWAALAIAMMTHAYFEYEGWGESEDCVVRFYKSESPNQIKYPPNIEFKEDEFGRMQPVWKGTIKAEKMKQLDMFEF